MEVVFEPVSVEKTRPEDTLKCLLGLYFHNIIGDALN